MKKKILLAEDDKKIGAALEIRLKAAGYDVEYVPDGFRSDHRAIGNPPDLLLMDIFMPVANGLAVAHELERAGLAHVPIIFMTASKEKNLRERAYTNGAVGFFEKPLDTKRLLVAIAQALSRKSKDLSRFSVELDRNLLEVKADESARTQKHRMKKILIVEDDQKIALALNIRLKANGYTVAVTGDAISGASLGRQFKPDLILLDISMPAGDGLKLAENFSHIPETVDIPIIFITASKRPELLQKVMELGAVGLFEKPFDMDQLLERIDRKLKMVACSTS